MMNALPDRYASDDLVLRDPGDGRTLAQRLSKRYAARITGTFVVPGQDGVFAPLPEDLPPALADALRTRGIAQLYSHQAESWRATQAGAHVAIVTPTAVAMSLAWSLRCRRTDSSPTRVPSPAAATARGRGSSIAIK